MDQRVDLGRLDGLTLAEEVFETLHAARGAVVERIVSNGREVELGPGQALTIAARVRHRVLWTARPTIWVAVHFPA